MLHPDVLESAIKVWEFEEGPEKLKDLSGFGGDEEWLIFVPGTYMGSMPPSHDGWPDLPINVERFVIRLTDTHELEWHELEGGDWLAISCRG